MKTKNHKNQTFTKIFFLTCLFFFIGTMEIAAQNYALQFSANTHVVNIGKADYSGNWTVELWAKRTGTTNHATLLAGASSKLNLETWNATHKVGYTKVGASPADVTFNYTLPLNTWTHVAYVYTQSPTSLALYINGNLIETKTVALSLPFTSIGKSSESYIGLIDEMRIWKTARTNAEISDNMNRSVNPSTETNLLAYWYFDDRASTVTDLSANGATGAITGAAYVANDNGSFITTLPAMEMKKITCYHQNEFYVAPGSKNQELLCIEVQTSGVNSPLQLSALNITDAGSTDRSDMEGISVFYTGTDKNFSASTPVGTKQTPAESLTFQQNVTLKPGSNYFWVAADVKSTAVKGHILDAGLQNATINGVIYTPENQNPAGRRLIDVPETNVNLPYVSIIPNPAIYADNSANGNFTLNADTKILVTPETQKEGEFLSAFLKTPTGFTVPVQAYTGQSIPNAIILRLDPTFTNGAEGYKLISNSDSVVIKGLNSKGVFWGIQTLRQLLPVTIENKALVQGQNWMIPGVNITDYPRFDYRGIMLDVSRHFFSVDFVKKYIDLLSYYKVNVLHWHLVDEQGWRVEIKKYPKLQTISAWRNCGTGQYGSPDGSPYGGYYTQEQIKEIVAYATERNVEIIPEIELPGHSGEILAAYPEFACLKADGTSYPVSQVKCTGGVFSDVICGGKDASMKFYKDVLDEVLPLFPCKYVHIGGDEAPKDRWKVCPDCQAKITQLGFTGATKEEELQRYMFEEIGKYLISKGKEYIGWSEIKNSGTLPVGSILQDWIGGADLAVQTGHKAIMSSYYGALYISQRQSDLAIEPQGPGAITTLDQTYNYEPIPSTFTADQAKLVLGLEACLWTEWVFDGNHAEYMTSPRMQAMAETGWTPKTKKNLANFKKRLLPQYMRLTEMGNNYRRVESADVINVYKKITISAPTVINSSLEGVSYFWNDDNFSRTKSITVSKSGIYKCYTDYYGVQAVTTYEVVNTTGISSKYSDNIDLQIFPNPAKENVRVILKLKSGNGGAVHLINADGKILESKAFTGNEVNETIPVAKYGNQVLFVQVTSGYSTATKKLVVK